MEWKTLLYKKWKALCLLPFVGLLAGCMPSAIFDNDFGNDHNAPCELDYLPYETSIGANKFGCYMDGELLAVQGHFQEPCRGLIDNMEGEWDSYGQRALLNFYLDYVDMVIDIASRPVAGMNLCRLEMKCPEAGLRGAADGVSVGIICFDEANGIISGRFGPVDVPLCDDAGDVVKTVRLTDGRFDMKFK